MQYSRLVEVSKVNLRGQSFPHFPLALISAQATPLGPIPPAWWLTMSSTPWTEVGCMILILEAFLEETQCSSSSSSTTCSSPASENLTTAPIGTSNSPPFVLSSQTWSPCVRGERGTEIFCELLGGGARSAEKCFAARDAN